MELGYEMQTTILRLPNGKDSISVSEYVAKLPKGVLLISINNREPAMDWTISIGNEVVLRFQERELLDDVRAKQLI